MSNMFDDARNRLKEKNSAVKVRSAANDYSSEDMFDAARKRLKEKQGRQTQNSMATANSKVEIPQVTPAGSASVADLLPKPTTEAELRNYAAQMQQPAHDRAAHDARYGAGNIDLYNRPQYRNADGSISTVDSRGYNIDGVEMLLPSVWMKDGKPYHSQNDDEVVQHYRDTGEYLGKFNTVAESNAYAEKLHKQQEAYYTPKKEGKKTFWQTIASGLDEFGNQLANPFAALDKLDLAVARRLAKITGKEVSPYQEERAYDWERAIQAGTKQNTTGTSGIGRRFVEGMGAAGNMVGSTLFAEATGIPGVLAQYAAPAAAAMQGTEAALGSGLGSRVAAGATRAAGNALAEVAAGTTNWAISAQSGINTYDKAIREGASENDALAAGIGSAAAEYFSNKLFGGTPLEDVSGETGYVTEILESAIKRAGKEEAYSKFMSSLGGRVAKFAFDKIGEGNEEVVTGFLDPLIARLTYNPEEDLATAEDLWDEFIGGVAMSVIMGAGEKAVGVAGAGEAYIENTARQRAEARNIETANRNAANNTQAFYDAAAKNGLFAPETAQAQRQAADANRAARQRLATAQGADPASTRNANAQIINALNDADRSYTLGEETESTANTGTGSVVLPTAAQNGMLPTYAHSEGLTAIIDAASKTGKVSENMVKKAMGNPSVMREIGLNENMKGSTARAEVRSRLESLLEDSTALENQQNRGIINTSDAIETNNDAVEEGTANGRRDVSVSEGSQRTDGQSAGERTGIVAEASGRVESEGSVTGENSAAAGRTQRTLFTETEGTAKITSVADAKDKSIGDLSFGEEVDSTKYFGKKGSSDTKFREVIGGDTKNVKEARRLAKEAGADLILVAGDDISYADGRRSRAVIRRSGGKKTIVARVDDSDADVAQLVQHELGHDKIRDGKLNVSKAVERFRKNFSLGEGEADALIDTYLRIKFGDDTIENASEKERQAAITELVCDTLGDIDELAGVPALKAWSDGFQALKRAVQESMEEDTVQTEKPEKTGENVSSGADMERSNAPPKVVNGISVAPDVAEIMESEDYSAPSDYMDLSVSTRNAWKESYKKQFNTDDENRVVKTVDLFTDKMIANDAIMGYVPVGSYKYNKKGPLRKNIEYIFTFDMDTSCPRTFQFLNYRNALQQMAGRYLTYNESVNLLELMRAYGQQIPCAYCYVENKRVLLSASYNNFFTYRQAVMNAETDEEAKKLMYSYKDGEISGAAQKVFDKWRSDRNYNPDVTEVWNSSQQSRNSILDFLDAQKENGKITNKTGAGAIKKMVTAQFGITEKGAVSEAASYIADWMYDVNAGVEHIYNVENTGNTDVDQRALALHHEALAYAKSASSAKTVENYMPYTDQIKYISENDKAFINGMGGIRKHSSNDFRIDYVQDYIMFFADLAAGGWMGHTYTKSTDYVKVFGKTGDRINMSIAMYGDTKETVRENLDEGMGWKDAKELRKAYKDAGVMAMVTSDAQLSYALNSDWVDMIIPFHASGLDKSVWYNLRMWNDYTSKQLERFLNSTEKKEALKAKGVEIPKGANAEQISTLYDETFKIKKITAEDGSVVKPHFFPGDTYVNGQMVPGHHNDVETYKKLCAEYGVHPRFYGIQVEDANGNTVDVTDHPGYLKLIKETSRTDSEQEKIKFNFDEKDDFLGMSPLDYAMQRMEQEAKNGGFENTKEDPYGVVNEFKNEYLNKDRPLGYLTDRAKQYKADRDAEQQEAAKKLKAQLEEDSAVPEETMDMSTRPAKKIAVGMTDSERADILREKTIPEVTYDGSAESAISENKGNLESMSRAVVSKTINRLKKNFDIPKEITNDDYQMVVTTASGVFSESVSKEITDVKQLVKLMPIISRVVESAVGIESHSNRYYYDNNTVLFHNMIGGYVDGDSFVPIRFGVKQSVDGNNYLYVVIDNEAIKKAEVMRRHTYDNHRPDTDYSATFNVSDILSKVNSKEILKYVPDEFLDEERKSAKYQAIAETIKKTNDKNDDKYAKFISDGKLDAAMRMVVAAAKAHGYTIRAWHGSRNVFRSFSKNKLGSSTNTESSKRWFFAADEETANSYYPRGVMEQLVKQGMFSQKDLDSMDKRGVSGKLYSLFIKMENPLEVDVAGYDYAAHREKADAMVEYLEQAERNNNDGIILYNVRDNNLKPDVENSTDYLFREPSQAKLADVITYDEDGNVVPISQRFNDEKPDMNFSTRSTSSELRSLQNENKRLKKQVEYWQQQTKATTEWKADAKQEAENAKSILKSVSSKANADDVTKRITKLHEDMSNGRLTYEDGKAEAVNIAADIVNKSSAMVSKDVESYNEAKRIFHSTAQTDVAYKQLQQMFGEDMFPRAITTREMLENINEYFDLVKPIAENPYDLGKAMIIEDVANDIVDSGMEIRQAKPTVIDKERAKAAEAKDKAKRSAEEQRLVDAMYYGRLLAEERAKHKEALAKERGRTAEAKAQAKADAKQQREISKAELEVQKQTDDMYYGRKLEQIRRQRDAKIDSILQHQREVVKNRREARQEASDRNRLLKIVRRLNGKKIDPTTRSMLPDIVKELDTVAVNITGKTLENLSDLRDWYNEKTDKNSADYDPNFAPDNATKAKLDRLEKAMRGRTIGDMPIEDVRALTEVLQNIEHNMLEGRKFQNSQVKNDNYNAAMHVINDVENAKSGKIDRKLNPLRAVRRIVGYADGSIAGTTKNHLITLTEEMIDGGRKAKKYESDNIHRFDKWLSDKQFMRDLYGKHAKSVYINGVNARTGEIERVEITPAMRISLYLHSLNDDNMRHIQGAYNKASDSYNGGGLLIPDMKEYRKGNMEKAYAADHRIKLTKANINAICAKMDAKEVAFAKAMHTYFNEIAPKALNEASMLIDGYEKFNVDNYFPISVDKNFLSQDFEGIKVNEDGSLTHPGFGEERIQSSKPIYLRDVNTVLMTAIRQNSMYAYQAVPLMNMNKLLNVQSIESTDSVQAALGRKYGDGSATRYIKKFMQDYAGNKNTSKSTIEKALVKMRSNYAGGVLTLSAGTAIKQAASYPGAAAILRTGSLVKGITGKLDVSFIDEMTSTYTRRKEGFSNIELAEMAQQGKHIPAALNWIQAVDVATTNRLKQACAYEVLRNGKYQPGTMEYKKAVVDLYNRVIEETQPNYSTELRPDILRSDSALERSLVMFATQPMQNFGILYDAIGNYNAKRTAYQNSKSKETEAALKDAGKSLGKAVGSQVASALVFSLMQYLWDALRKKDDKYRDDDGELTMLSRMKGVGMNMLGNGAGMFVGGKVVLDFAEALADSVSVKLGGKKIFNAYSSGFEVAELAAIADVADSVSKLTTTIAGQAGDKEFDASEMARSVWSVAEDAGVMFGIPLKNVTTDLTAIAKHVVAAMNNEEKYIGNYYILAIDKEPESNKQACYQNLWKCYKNGTRSELRKLYREMLDDGFTDTQIKNAMETRMKEEQGVKSVDKLTRRWEDII